MANPNPAAANKPVDIGVLSGFLNGIGSRSVELVQNLPKDRTLCHYTSLEGALGIISGNDLWLTNTRFSNDDEEMIYGRTLVIKVLDDLKNEMSIAFLDSVRESLEETKDEQVYICCFCENDNLLSQWRGYAENGSGVSIEFNPDGFIDITGHDSLHGLMRLWKVFYREEQQRQIIRDCLDYQWPVQPEERVMYAVNALQFFMPTFKNPDFQEEKERRLIFTPYPVGGPKLKFRTSRRILVPYLSLRELAQPPGAPGPAFQLPIKSLLIGPGPHRKLNVESVKMALEAYGHPDVPVRATSTPFRG